MRRFLRYSLEKGRKIRAVLMLDGQMVQRTLLVLEDGEEVEYTVPHVQLRLCPWRPRRRMRRHHP